MVTNKDIIPNFVKARSPKALRKLMFKEAMRLKMQVSFYDIQFVNGTWYAWYNVKVTDTDEVRERPLATEARDGRIV